MSEFNLRTEHTARKQHRCFACGDTIEPGERYSRWKGVYDGCFFSSAEHQTCAEVYEEYDFDGEAVSEGYAIENAHEHGGWRRSDDDPNRQQAGESNRDYVARMLEAHRASKRPKLEGKA